MRDGDDKSIQCVIVLDLTLDIGKLLDEKNQFLPLGLPRSFEHDLILCFFGKEIKHRVAGEENKLIWVIFLVKDLDSLEFLEYIFLDVTLDVLVSFKDVIDIVDPFRIGVLICDFFLDYEDVEDSLDLRREGPKWSWTKLLDVDVRIFDELDEEFGVQFGLEIFVIGVLIALEDEQNGRENLSFEVSDLLGRQCDSVLVQTGMAGILEVSWFAECLLILQGRQLDDLVDEIDDLGSDWSDLLVEDFEEPPELLGRVLDEVDWRQFGVVIFVLLVPEEILHFEVVIFTEQLQHSESTADDGDRHFILLCGFHWLVSLGKDSS